jgi:L-threonylcarbamoyladenylate synthase
VSTYRFFSPSPGSGLLRLAEVETVVASLRAGGLAVLPTETGHMLAAVVTSEPALRSAFAAKRRSRANPMHIACASIEMAERYAELPVEARLLLGAFTPGPLTVVVPQRDTLPGELVTAGGTVGIRVPDHPSTLQVVASLGVPVTATSLNRSGEESRPPDPAVLDDLNWGGAQAVPVVRDPEAVRFPSPSTLVRLTTGRVELLRPGPIELAEIERVLAGAQGRVTLANGRS